MTNNPPTSVPSEAALPAGAESTFAGPTLPEIARPVFLAWERLRIVYVLLLGILTLIFAGPELARLSTVIFIVEGAMVANICFFAGPVVETYARWLGYEGRVFRWFLFVGGTVLTATLAVATLVPFLPADVD